MDGMANLNLWNWWRGSRWRAGHNTPHMTFASKTMSRSMSRTRLFLSCQLWVFPILAVIALAILGFFVRRAIESTMKESLRSHMQTLLDVETAMLENWFKHQATIAESQAIDLDVREHIYKLLNEVDPTNRPETQLKDSPVHRLLQKELAPKMSAHDFIGYIVLDRNKQILSATNEELIGRRDVADYAGFVTRTLAGETTITPPVPSVALQKDEFGETRVGVPTMFVCAPVRDDNFQVVAAAGAANPPRKGIHADLATGSHRCLG